MATFFQRSLHRRRGLPSRRCHRAGCDRGNSRALHPPALGPGSGRRRDRLPCERRDPLSRNAGDWERSRCPWLRWQVTGKKRRRERSVASGAGTKATSPTAPPRGRPPRKSSRRYWIGGGLAILAAAVAVMASTLNSGANHIGSTSSPPPARRPSIDRVAAPPAAGHRSRAGGPATRLYLPRRRLIGNGGSEPGRRIHGSQQTKKNRVRQPSAWSPTFDGCRVWFLIRVRVEPQASARPVLDTQFQSWMVVSN